MSETVPLITPPIDRSLFSLHPEDAMTEHAFHDNQLAYLKHALGQVLPGLFVARNMAVYWVPGQRRRPYIGPDLLVARRRPPGENPSCFLTYEDGPLTLVVEVASEETRRNEPKKRDETYAARLVVPEHLYIDGDRHVLELSVLVGGRYEQVAPDAAGRHWSRELGIGFAWQEDGRLVRVVTSDGAIVPSGAEEAALRLEADRRRAEAESRAEALAAEVERLRRALKRGGDAPPAG
jgi:hypothetical protein